MDTAQQIIKEWILKNNPQLPLDLGEINLEELPEIPINCEILHCANCYLKKLPTILYVKELQCYKNQIENLPELPNCVKLICSENKLKKLPELPKCEVLYCHHNELTVLPDLPNCRDLLCSYNMLTKLPKLPKCKELWCRNNKLTIIDLPQLIDLRCTNNKLRIIADMPECIYFSAGGNYLYVIPKCLTYHELDILCRLDKQLRKKHIKSLLSDYYSELDSITINFDKFAAKIQNKWRKHKKYLTFVELHKMYIKNVSTVICQYLI